MTYYYHVFPSTNQTALQSRMVTEETALSLLSFHYCECGLGRCASDPLFGVYICILYKKVPFLLCFCVNKKEKLAVSVLRCRVAIESNAKLCSSKLHQW